MSPDLIQRLVARRVGRAMSWLFAAAALDPKGQRALALTIAALVLAAAVLGAVQVSMGPDGPYLYAQNNRTLTGFQANRNAAADVFLIGMAAGAAFAAPWLAGGVERSGRRPGLLADRRAAAVALAGLVVLLLFATLFTASRTGIALLPLVRARQFSWWLVPPALAFVGMSLSFLQSMVWTTAANAIWLQNIAPAWVCLFMRLSGEKIDRRDLRMFGFAACGIALILWCEMSRAGWHDTSLQGVLLGSGRTAPTPLGFPELEGAFDLTHEGARRGGDD